MATCCRKTSRLLLIGNMSREWSSWFEPYCLIKSPRDLLQISPKLAWRPTQWTTTEQVNVKVVHGLPSVPPTVDHGAIAIFES